MPSLGKALLRCVTTVALLGAFIFASAAPSVAAASNNAAFIIDGNTGSVLYSRNADATRYPASLTKMMTLYLLFEDLERGKVSLNSRLMTSRNAANQAPTKLGLAPGDTISVEDAILALVTKSANDVAMVIAENLSASEDAFAQRMTQTARSLGMNATTFRNPHGLPDSGQVTTARDMATLARALHDRFPQYYHYFSTPSFTWHGVTIANHDNLLGEAGIDGLKTGYTSASGYNLVTSYQLNGRYVVGVVMGGDTAAGRDQTMRELLAQYVPHASSGPRTAPLVVASPLDLIPVPMPRVNPIRTDPIMTAGVLPPAPVPQGTAEGDFDPAQPPPPMPATPWAIQVGALNSASLAEGRLNDALNAAPTVLAGMSPYTESVAANGAVLYRARFVGFASRDAAVAACAQIELHGIDCYVPAL